MTKEEQDTIKNVRASLWKAVEEAAAIDDTKRERAIPRIKEANRQLASLIPES